MNAREIADNLRTMAADIEAEPDQLNLPREEYTLDQAYYTLRKSCCNSDHVRICFKLCHYTFSETPNVHWEACVGKNESTAATLTAAVNGCLDSIGSKEKPGQAAVNVFNEATHADPVAAAAVEF
jgi:hypothetical protein